MRLRLTTRRTLGAVAVAGLLLAVWNDRTYRPRRDDAVKAGRFWAEMASWHGREVEFCLEQERLGRPYHATARVLHSQAQADRLLDFTGIVWDPETFTGWAAEASRHREGVEIDRRAIMGRAEVRRDAERHLIFP